MMSHAIIQQAEGRWVFLIHGLLLFASAFLAHFAFDSYYDFYFDTARITEGGKKATKLASRYMLAGFSTIIGVYYIGEYASGGYSPHFALLYAVSHALMLIILRMNGTSIESLKFKWWVVNFLSAWSLAAAILGFCMTDFDALLSDSSSGEHHADMHMGDGPMRRREAPIAQEESNILYLVQGILFIVMSVALYSGAGFEQSYDVAAFEADELHVTKVSQSTFGAGMSMIFGMANIAIYVDDSATAKSGLFVAIGTLIIAIQMIQGISTGELAASHARDQVIKFWTVVWIAFAVFYFLSVDYKTLELEGAAIDAQDAGILVLLEGIFLLTAGLVAQFFSCHFNRFHFDFSNADAPAKASVELLSKYYFSQASTFAGSLLVGYYFANWTEHGPSVMAPRFALFFTLGNATTFALVFLANRSCDLVSSAFMKQSVVTFYTAFCATWTIVGFLITDFSSISAMPVYDMNYTGILDIFEIRYITLGVGIINVLVGILAYANPAKFQTNMFSTPATAATNAVWGWVLSSAAFFNGMVLIGLAYNHQLNARLIGVLALATVFNIDTWLSAINSGDAAKLGAKNPNGVTVLGLVIAVLWFLGVDAGTLDIDTGALFSVIAVYYCLVQTRK